MRRVFEAVACAVILTAAGGAIAANDGSTIPVPKVDSEIRIDGVLDEDAWNRARVIELPYEVTPGENIPAPVRTQVLLCYGHSQLYVAFRAFDPNPGEIRARYSDRDKMGDDDWVGIVLDTFNDARRAFDFLVNPLGVQADLIETTGGEGIDEWDAIWNSSGRITADGYVVEMAIPFSSLRFQRTEGDQVWRFDAVRSYPRGVTHRLGTFPRDRSNNCYLCQALVIEGFAGADPGRSLEIDPTLSAVYAEERRPFPDGQFEELNSTIEAGITVSWGITPNLNLNATVNPDFSQVEADAAQLDVNTRFSLYYDEKRPFFLEGADYFRTPINAVYTRTLADPTWGVKTAGKVGRGAIGFFSVRDDVTNLLFPDTEGSRQTSLDSPSTGTVFRYRRDVGMSSTVGAMVTSREADGYHNRVYGGDIDLRLSETDTLRFQALFSSTEYPLDVARNFEQREDEFTGNGFEFFYTHETRSWQYYTRLQRFSPEFRADLGFVPQTGFAFLDTGVLYTWQHDDPDHWYNRIGTWVGYERTEDAEGNMLRSAPGAFLSYSGPLQSSLYCVLYLGDQTYHGHEFGDRNLSCNMGFNPIADLRFRLEAWVGDSVDYAEGRAADRLRLVPSIDLFAGRHLSLTFGHTFETLDVDVGRLYTANLSELRSVFQFNRRTFVRLILQHTAYDFETENYEVQPHDPKFRHLLTQWLFTYKINPQTALYLGYSDNYQGDSRISLTQLNRTAFFKIGYAWVP